LGGKRNSLESLINGMKTYQCDEVNGFDMSKTRIDDSLFIKFVEVMPKYIQELSLSNSALGLTAAFKLAEFLKGTNSLKYLNLS
jgi:hypothetical protein